MNKECLLISPPGELYIFPRGIMEIATFLNQQGYPTSVLPLGYHFKNNYAVDEAGYIEGDIDKRELCLILEDTIRELAPAVIGVSNCYTKDFNNCIEIVKICKEIDPRIITIMGGTHATFCDAECLQTPELDVVVRGEGEWVTLNLLREIYEKRDFRSIKGITIRENGGVRRNKKEGHGELDQIPPVDFNLLPKDYVKMSYVHGILHRGCAYHCRYCTEEKFWGKPRSYRIQKLIEEMKVLQNAYGTQYAGLEESMSDMRSKKFFAFLEGIRENGIGLPKDFYITTRIDTITDEGVEAMRRVGITHACVGIESFSPRVLKMMKKRLDPNDILKGCRRLTQGDIWLNGYWLIGHPGDNTFEADYTFSHFKMVLEKGLLKGGYAFIFVPYPGTEYFNDPERYGIRISSYDWRRWRRWTTEPVSYLEDFSAPEIVAAYGRAKDLLSTYKKFNHYLASSKESLHLH